MLGNKTINIFYFILLFIKKQYRISFSKKRRFIGEEFSYLSNKASIKLSKLFSFLEILVKVIFPITTLFYPVNFKYIALSILSILYIFKMKEFKIKRLNIFFHKVFIKDALFELIGIIIITLNLIILLEVKILLFISLIAIFHFLKLHKLRIFSFYIYLTIYFLFLINLNNNYISSFLIILLFVIFLSFFIFYCKYSKHSIIMGKKNTKNRYLLYIDIQRISRKLQEKKGMFYSYIFPPYIITYILFYYIIKNTIFVREISLVLSLLLVAYFVIFYIYVKRQIFLLDDCFYFSTTKIEFYKSSSIFNYLQKIVILIFLNFFNIFWGIAFLKILFGFNWSIKIVVLLILIHIFILLLALSANIYVDKNKSEVTRYPEDIKKYMSLLEAIFLSSLFILAHIFIYIILNGYKKINKIDDIFSLNSTLKILLLIVFLLGISSAIKTINHIWVTKKNIGRR